MGCSSVYFEDEPMVADDWLEQARESLYQRWVSTTRHKPGRNSGTWACEIYRGCRTCREHLSLPCSLLTEANDIGRFLGSPCGNEAPESFLRHYLFILAEFVGQLADIAGFMDLAIGKPPKTLVIWANRWCKHRFQILVQHHPGMLFADQYGDRWSRIQLKLATEPFEDNCGNEFPVLVIDTNWLKKHDAKGPNLSEANGPNRAVIAVPPMVTFLDETISYFRRFVDECLRNSEIVRRFESEHYRRGC